MWHRRVINSISWMKLQCPVSNSRELNTGNKTESVPSTTWSWSKVGSKKLTLKDVPGPSPSLPLIGTTWQYFKGGRYHSLGFHDTCLDKFNRYGPVVKEEFQWGKPIVHVFDPEDTKKVFQHQGPYPIRSISEFVQCYRKSNPDRYDSVGLANSLGEEWHRMRQILAPALLKLDSLDDLVEGMDVIGDDFVTFLRAQRDTRIPKLRDFQSYAELMALEGAFLMSLDSRLGCLKKGILSLDALSMIHSISLLFEAYQELYYGLPFWKLFETDSYKKLAKAESQIYDLSSARIENAMEKMRQSRESKSKKSVLDTLLKTENLTDKEIKVTVMDFISGGVFTVSSAFTFLIDNIARNPEAQEKLYDELVTVTPSGKITKAILNKLPYLKACLKESFRLTPTIPFINRILTEEVVLSGYSLPAGTPVLCNFIVPCRQNSIISKPDDYIPDRWLDRQFRPHPFSMLPFGFGTRMCVGKRFAELELHVALAKMVYNFKISPSSAKVGSKQDFIVTPSHSVDVLLYERGTKL